jgi:filamentous hemagglutinin
MGNFHKAKSPFRGPGALRSVGSGLLAVVLSAALSTPAFAGDVLRGGATRANDASRAAIYGGASAAAAARMRASSQGRLDRTADMLKTVQSAQMAARAAARRGPASLGINPLTGARLPVVPEGLGPGALDLDHVAYGANNPTQSGTTVNITQTAQQALLNWKSFNVGRRTAVNFDQSAGGADAGEWVAINKVTGADIAPSQILGRINAQGQVYVINQNGIIFGGSSQVRAQTFVASSLPINDNLLQSGLLNNNDAQFLFTGLPVAATSSGAAAFTPPTPAAGRFGDVTVQPGAMIRGTGTQNGDGGRVMLVGPNVNNEGAIQTAAGQTILAAGLQVGVAAHSQSDPSLRGLDVWVGQVGTYGGGVVNRGLVSAPTGSILLAGRTIDQSGVLDSSTSVDLNGRIDILASFGAVSNPGFNAISGAEQPAFLSQFVGSVNFGPSSVTRVVTDDAGGRTIPGTELAQNSQINVEGRGIYFAPGSIMLATSGDVSVRAGLWPFKDADGDGTTLDGQGRYQAGLSQQFEGGRQKFLASGGQIFLDAGATIDVSGSTDAYVEQDEYLLTVQMRGSEFADSPLQRDGDLRAIDLVVDLRESGTYGGRPWVGTPLGDLTGYAAIIEKDVAQLTARGGTVSLSAGDSVVLNSGSIVDVSGGLYTYEAGDVRTSRLVTGGTIVDVRSATPDQIYNGVFTGVSSSVSSGKWGTSKSYSLPLAPLGGYYQESYQEGAAAGTVSVTAPSIALDGELRGATLQGARQQDAPAAAGILQLAFEGEKDVGTAVNPIFVKHAPFPVDFQVAAAAAGTGGGLAYASTDLEPAPLPGARRGDFRIDPSTFDPDRGGFADLIVRNADGDFNVPAGTPLVLPPGGRLSVEARNINIAADVTAPAGSVELTAYNFSPYLYNELSQTGALAEPPTPGVQPGRGTILLAAGTTIDVAGMLVDERTVAPGAQRSPRLLHAGSVDLTGYSILLQEGSRIDASGGIWAGPGGSFEFGDGGSIALRSGRDPDLETSVGGRLQLDGILQAYSAREGGALSIQSNFIRIGGNEVPDGGVVLAPEFFTRGGFTSYELTGIGGRDAQGGYLPAVSVAEGTTLAPVAEAWLQSPDLTGAPANRAAVAARFLSRGGVDPSQFRSTDEVERMGGRVLAGSIFQPVLPEQGLRSPASISFVGLGYNDRFTGSSIVDEYIDGLGLVVFETGSRIVTDAGASISATGDFVALHGEMSAPGGDITIKGRSSFRLAPLAAETAVAALPTVYIGPTARLSAAGTTVSLPDDFGRRSGILTPGGTITVSGNILADAGSVLDVSGAQAVLDFHPSRLSGVGAVSPDAGVTTTPWGRRSVAVPLASDGGTITLAGSQMLYSDATLNGAAGGPSALGGTLAVSSGRFYAAGLSRSGADINLVVEQTGSAAAFGKVEGAGAAVQRALAAGENPLEVGGGDPSSPGAGYFAVDTFSAGGFDNLDLGFVYNSGASPVPFGGNVEFVGPVDIRAAGSVRLAGGGVIKADSPVTVTAAVVAVGQEFQAPLNPADPFVPFRDFNAATGATPQAFVAPTAGSGSLSFSAPLIDIGYLSLQGVSRASFTAEQGDIRGNGSINIAGQLDFRAGQIYPTTLAPFDIFAYDNPLTGQPGTVNFFAAGLPALPYSAGGQMRVMASVINQGGNLRAPLGSITLGWDGTDTDPSDSAVGAPVNSVVGTSLATPVAQRVSLLGGSVTSVSAIDPATGEGLLLPFGLSPDGLAWIDPRGVDVTVGGLPARGVAIAGQSVVMDAGSTIDLRGGGDLLAYRWVSGNGGSADLLGTARNGWASAARYAAGDLVLYDGKTFSARGDINPADYAVTPEPTKSALWIEVPASYAVIPGFSSPFAPLNEFNTGPNSGVLAGDPGYASDGLRMGEQVQLAGIQGLPTGSYTLLPPRYAVMPGAFLVIPEEGALTGSASARSTAATETRSGFSGGATVRREEGSFLVGGFSYNAFNRAARPGAVKTRYEVLPPGVLAGRVEYEVFTGNEFFADAAARLDVADVQQLPADAARLAVHGNSGLSLAGTVLGSGDQGGRGADIDLSSFAPIYLTDGSAAAPAGATAVLDVRNLDTWTGGSLLVGGLRRATESGMVVDVRAPVVEANHPATPLTGPDVTLAAKQRVVLGAGSALQSDGSAGPGAGTLQVVGDGALLRVSRDAASAVLRTGVGASGAELVVGAGARLAGEGVIMDSSSAFDLDPSAVLDATSLTMASGQISILLEPPSGGLVGSVVNRHLVLDGAALRQAGSADILRLQSYRTVDIYGDGVLGSADLDFLEVQASGLRGFGVDTGASVLAGSILLGNPVGASVLPPPAGASGQLSFFAGDFLLGSGALALDGFSRTAVWAQRGVRSLADGGLTVAGSLSMAAPFVDVAQGTSYKLASTGAMDLLSTSPAGAVAPGLGARLALEASAITIGTSISLPSGVFTARALSGDIVVTGNVGVEGTSRAFFDQVVAADAGRIELVAAAGKVAIGAGGRVSVGASGGGDAGTLLIESPGGPVRLDGILEGHATGAGAAGSFLLDAGSVPDFAALSARLDAAGFAEQRVLRVRSGQVVVPGLTKVRNFALSTDAGDITVTGTIDASGATGGSIWLASARDLTIAAGARLSVAGAAFSNAGKGGEITLEAGSAVNGVSDPTAWLDLQAGSQIDLSVASHVPGSVATPGSSAFLGQFEGTLHLRAPRSGNDALIGAIGSTITGGSSILAEAFRVYRPAGGVMNIALRNTLNNDNRSFINASEATIRSRLLGGGNASLDPLLVVAPGVEIVNPTGDLVLGLANVAGTTNIEGLSDADWDLSGWRYGTRSAPGVLTLRAQGDIVFNNALSDGFTPITKGAAANYAASGNSLLWLAPLQSISASLPVNTQSWSYRLAAGADLAASAFDQVLDPGVLDMLQPGKGSVVVGEFFATPVPNNTTSGQGAGVGRDGQTADTIRINIANNNADRGTRYEVVRTGTGDIAISAGRDVRLRNPFATIYTAGVGLPDRSAVFVPGDFALPVTAPSRHPDQGGALGAVQQNYAAYYGMAGGDLDISAHGDIGRFARLPDVPDTSFQLPTHWLYRRGLVDSGTGSFANLPVVTGIGAVSDPSASTTWWIDYSNFFQGFGALGGGNINLTAGDDLINVEAAIPTSARMAGIDPATGLRVAPSADRLVELGGGDLVARAGSDLDGGSFYIERGTGRLAAGDDITTNEARSPSVGRLANQPPLDPLTWLAVTLYGGRAQFDVAARGDVLLGPTTSAFLLPQGLNNKFWYKTQFQTISRDAGVVVASYGGGITHRLGVTLPGDTIALPALSAAYGQASAISPGSAGFYRPWVRLTETSLGNFRTVASVALPSLESTAFSGDISVTGAINLFPSPSGGLSLLAAGGIVGLNPSGKTTIVSEGVETPVTAWTAAVINVSDADATRVPGVLTPAGFQQTVGTTTSLTVRDSSINPFAAVDRLFSETGSFSGASAALDIQTSLHAPVPVHSAGGDPVRVYAGGGDIVGLTLFAPKELRAFAARDITDIAFYLQHVAGDDISIVSAGRDIVPFNANAPLRSVADNVSAGNYIVDAAAQTVVLDATGFPVATKALAGDIQVSGQGILEVLAGRNLDLGTGANFRDGTGLGVTSIGQARNPFLPFEGAHIVLMSGLGSPSGGPALGLAGSTLTFPELPAQGFLGSTREHVAVAAVRKLFEDLQIFGLEASESGDYTAAYAAVDSIFGSTAGSGNIFTRARDVRTASGGSIIVASPGGGLTMASDIFGNPLTPPGIVTEYGGEVSVLTDGDVDIGRARIFTLRGGDLTIWSSSGDIAAGTAPKTVVTAPPTRVIIDPTSADVKTDLGGLATGGGIGVLASVEGVEPGSVSLLAPQGTVDAGDAGIRATGDINIAAAEVLNADNIAAGGTSAGVPSAPPAVAPNIAGLTAGASTTAATSTAAGSMARQSQGAAETGAQDEPPSVITVEVLGYGGGESAGLPESGAEERDEA